MNDQLMRTDDVAVLLDVHPNTVRNLVKQGRLEVVRVGSSVRFEAETVRKFVEACRVASKGD